MEELIMARPVYPHELVDPDFQWLLNTFRETHPNYISVEVTCLPVTLVASEWNVAPVVEGVLVPSSDPSAIPALDEGDEVVDEKDLV